MIIPQPLLRTWEKRCMRRSPVRSLIMSKKGIDFGVTRLAKFEGDALVFENAKLLALLSIANGDLISENCLENIRRSERCFKRREYALAQMELALIGIRAFDSIEQVQRLFMAEWLMSKGETPREVLKCAGIVKYNPYHLGPGPGGGQFTTADRNGQSNGLPPGAGVRDSSLTLKPSTGIPAGGTQVAAGGRTISDSDSPFPSDDGKPLVSPTSLLLPSFMTEDIAEAAVGGYNWIRELFQDNDATPKSSLEAEINFTDTVESKISDRPYINSPGLIQEIVSTNQGIADPGGIPNALRYDVPGNYNSSKGTYELVINPKTGKVYHFLFRSGQ